MTGSEKKTLAVFKFASCDGCQLTLLDCEDELLPLAEHVTIAHFAEASSRFLDGPYDVVLVEGSITTESDRARIQEVRRQARVLVTIGACATAGGIQALRNYDDVQDYIKTVYAKPEYIKTLATSTAIAEHVPVDFELRGCPISKQQLLEVLSAFLHGRAPQVRDVSVCQECKAKGLPCVMVAHGTPCLGPVTHAGCAALCPSYNRGCFGCYGPKENAQPAALRAQLQALGLSAEAIKRLYRTFNACAEPFAEESRVHE